KIDRLTDVITNLGSIMQASIRQTNEIRQPLRNNFSYPSEPIKTRKFLKPRPPKQFQPPRPNERVPTTSRKHFR
ncbi:Uncharacterized protein APZ42_007035, partial [Daphnia magna]